MDNVTIISDADVLELERVGHLTAKALNDVVEGAYAARGAGETSDTNRQHLWLPDPSPDRESSEAGNDYFREPGSRGSFKSYSSGSHSYGVGANLLSVGFSPNSIDMWTLLFSLETGRLQALVQGGRFSALKTGAVAGVAVRHLAAPKGLTVAVIGTGTIGSVALEHLAVERPIERVLAYRRDRTALARFCAEATEKLGVPVQAAPDARRAVEAADVTVVATNAREPVVLGRWTRPQSLTISMGTHYPKIREVDSETVLAATLVVDSLEQARAEKGDYLLALEDDPSIQERVLEFPSSLHADRLPTPDQDGRITFMSCGLGTETIASAVLVFEKAQELGLGQRIAV